MYHNLFNYLFEVSKQVILITKVVKIKSTKIKYHPLLRISTAVYTSVYIFFSALFPSDAIALEAQLNTFL